MYVVLGRGDVLRVAAACCNFLLAFFSCLLLRYFAVFSPLERAACVVRACCSARCRVPPRAGAAPFFFSKFLLLAGFCFRAAARAWAAVCLDVCVHLFLTDGPMVPDRMCMYSLFSSWSGLCPNHPPPPPPARHKKLHSTQKLLGRTRASLPAVVAHPPSDGAVRHPQAVPASGGVEQCVGTGGGRDSRRRPALHARAVGHPPLRGRAGPR